MMLVGDPKTPEGRELSRDFARHNPGLPVAGYKPQSPEAVALVNSFKLAEERLLRSIEDAQVPAGLAPRWVAIARTHFEQGFMALNRAVFQPGRVALPEDDA